MFLRLFLTYLLMVLLFVVLVSLLILRQTNGDRLFRDLIVEVGAAVCISALVSVAVAYLFASRFTRPLAELTSGARKLAAGDFKHKIHVSAGREFNSLANTFNAMTDQIAKSFEEIELDREQLRVILSGMVEGVVAVSTDLRVLFANERAGMMLEFHSLTANGRKFWELTRQPGVPEVLERALKSGEPQRQELKWQGPGDRRLLLYASRFNARNMQGAMLVMHDITELRKLETLRQDFVTNVSHELKTPLANIKSSVEVLLDGAKEEPASLVMFLSEIDAQATRLESLIQDLLSLARIESGAQFLEPEALLVEDAVHACLDRHRTRAEAKGQTMNAVALGGAPANLTIWVDAEAFAQILDNLVDNAIKYTPVQGRVTVRWRTEEHQVFFEVEDTGLGIPEQDLPRVFERFYRVDKARSRSMGGTGLGLAIVKHLVQLMNGTIRVESQMGKGTKFSFSLPRAGSV